MTPEEKRTTENSIEAKNENNTYCFTVPLDIFSFLSLERAYRSICYGRLEPNRMFLHGDMFEHLDKQIFKNHPEVGLYKMFHGAKLRIHGVDKFRNVITFETNTEFLTGEEMLIREELLRAGKVVASRITVEGF